MSFKPKTQKKFIKYKEGKFYETTDKDLQNPLGDFEGRVVDIYLKKENIPNNPVPIEKLNLDLDGGNGDIFTLSLSFASSMTTKLIGFLKSVDLTQVLTLSPAFKKETDTAGVVKEIRTIFVKQGTDVDTPYAKQFYTKDDPKGVPKMKKLKSGKWDTDDFSDFFRDVVINELRPIVKGAKTQQLVEVPDTGEDTDGEEDEGDGKLPF